MPPKAEHSATARRARARQRAGYAPAPRARRDMRPDSARAGAHRAVKERIQGSKRVVVQRQVQRAAGQRVDARAEKVAARGRRRRACVRRVLVLFGRVGSGAACAPHRCARPAMTAATVQEAPGGLRAAAASSPASERLTGRSCALPGARRALASTRRARSRPSATAPGGRRTQAALSYDGALLADLLTHQASGSCSPRFRGRISRVAAPMASLGAALVQALRDGGLAPLFIALVAALALHLLLRARPTARGPRGPATLSPAVKARPRPRRRQPLGVPEPRAQVELRLVSRTELSHDTRRFRFALPVRTTGARPQCARDATRPGSLQSTFWACPSASTS